MASTGNISFFRRLLNPLRNTCIIQIFNCFPKHIKNRKQTSTDNSEVTVQVCSKEEEINKVSTTCIKEEERHEPSVTCIPEKEISKDTINETSIPCQAEQEIGNGSNEKKEKTKKMRCKKNKKQTKKVEPKEKSKPCTNEEEGCNASIKCTIEEETHEVSTSFKAEQSIASTTYTKNEQEVKPNFTSCTVENMLNKKERDGISTNSDVVTKILIQLNINWNHKEEKIWNRNDDWIPELNLKQQHKKVLQGTEWLDDEIIDAAQNLLRKQFNCDGLQSSLLCQMQFYPVNGPSVQIHYDMNHWLTSCLKQHHVEIADSLGRRYLTDAMKKQIRECYGGAVMSDPVQKTIILDVDQQPNSFDCGVYAIANAFEFLSNRNPSCKYNQTKMRRHLICCFEKGRFTAFPKRIDDNHDNSEIPVLYNMLNKKERDDDWIPELNLKQQHKKELQGTELLDDQIIDAAQNLLKKQFNCEGLQSSLLSQVQFYPVYGPSVQIHYDMNHWLTSCLKQHHVEIADSLGRRYLTDVMKKQIRECYGGAVTSDPVQMTKILDVDRQPNCHDCGVYAIANAYEFLANGNPTCKYNNKKMRKHLSHCFERREITAFPKKDSLPWKFSYNKRIKHKECMVKTSQSIYSPRDTSDGILRENFQLEIGKSFIEE
ncbi:hypothetical protein XELAEV_18046429mg [Xenopus laevis]|uniref:Ubiquitin-like protease family profile domain-containing protein n=1 Tax=Xenopus laevis TaxID=8355 RepID=A0A974H0J8_XENLA|nr:hypothetical protein XELAEV_18046429mg [Xenopus laevis]